MVFSDEKQFVIQQFGVMLWAAITADGRSPLVLIDHGVKINAEYYRENILESALKPWALRTLHHRAQHAPPKNG